MVGGRPTYAGERAPHAQHEEGVPLGGNEVEHLCDPVGFWLALILDPQSHSCALEGERGALVPEVKKRRQEARCT